MVGVRMAEPKHPRSANPTSSSTISTTSGLPAGGSSGAGHHGVDSATVRPMTPAKPSSGVLTGTGRYPGGRCRRVPAMGALEGKVAVVTGAAKGVGRASALAFSREGASVVVADVDEDGGRDTVGLIERAGGAASFVRTDVSVKADVEAMVAHAVGTYGGLDCAHNNAGITSPMAPLADYPDDGWDRAIAVQLTGVYYCLKAEIPQMLARGGGAIVNTASGVGLIGYPEQSAYTASKHGVIGLQGGG